jgi:hypothetical protein
MMCNGERATRCAAADGTLPRALVDRQRQQSPRGRHRWPSRDTRGGDPGSPFSCHRGIKPTNGVMMAMIVSMLPRAVLGQSSGSCSATVRYSLLYSMAAMLCWCSTSSTVTSMHARSCALAACTFCKRPRSACATRWPPEPLHHLKFAAVHSTRLAVSRTDIIAHQLRQCVGREKQFCNTRHSLFVRSYHACR